MPYIIKDSEELKDPFLCFCIFMRFFEEAEEDYMDYNENIVDSYPFIMWMLRKGYINNDKIEELCDSNEIMTIQDLLSGGILFPNTYGNSGFACIKSYSILAEYMSCKKEFRERLYNSVNDMAFGFDNNEFYKNDDGVSLACIIEEMNMVESKKYTKDNIDVKNIWDLTYKERYNFAKSITIYEADNLGES